MQKDPISLRGAFHIEHRNKAGDLIGVYRVPNGIVTEGINHILNTQFNDGSKVTSWYIGLVNSPVSTGFSNADTLASHSGWTENTAYTEGARVLWDSDAASSRSITNSSTADFSINSSVSLYGIFVSSVASGTSGVLWSTAQFASVVTAGNGDTLKVTYSITG